jgi:hypothetical protein
MGGGSVNVAYGVHNGSARGAIVDDRDTALEKTTAASKNPPKERAPGVSWGFFFQESKQFCAFLLHERHTILRS